MSGNYLARLIKRPVIESGNDGMRRPEPLKERRRAHLFPLLLSFSLCSHINQTSSWLPPIDNWNGSIQAGAAGGMSLPYGWEAATDREGKAYFIK